MKHEGTIWKNIIDGLGTIIEAKKAEDLVNAGAYSLRHSLEYYGIYLGVGKTLEYIVLNSTDPYRELSYVREAAVRIMESDQVEVVFKAVQAVYHADTGNSEKVIPFEKFMNYYPYVKPIVSILCWSVNESHLYERYKAVTKNGYL